MKHLENRKYWIASQLAFAGVVAAAGALSGDPALGIGCAAILLLAIVAYEVARRRGSSAGEILSGVGDERNRGIYRAAGFRTSELFSYFLGVFGLISMAGGRADSTLVTVIMVWGGLWILNITWATLQARRPLKAAAH